MDKRTNLFGYEDGEVITIGKVIRDKLVKKNKKLIRRGALLSTLAAVLLVSGGAYLYQASYKTSTIMKVTEKKGALSINAEHKTSAQSPEVDPTLATEAQEDGENNIVIKDTSGSKDHPFLIRVNRKLNVVNVYSKDENGNYTVPFKAMVCSVGKNGATPTGTFKTSTKYEWHALYANTFGQYAYRINGPIMFHSVPYTAERSDALEAEEFNKLGEAASLGCVRLSVADAKWLVDNCPEGTTVEIFDSNELGPFGKPGSIKIDLDSPNAGWDPTDPVANNPWANT